MLILLAGQTAIAQSGTNTYIVTKTVDTNGPSCDTGDCSLREAINAANADGVPSVIKFNFTTGSAPYTIFVRGSALPPLIADETTIDGLLDNGYNLGDVIIDGTIVFGSINGFTIMGESTNISGLQIQNFTSHGIFAGDTGRTIGVGIVNTIIIENAGSAIFSPIHLNLVIDGCYLGTDPAYTSGLGNGEYGVNYSSSTSELPPVLRVTNTAIASNGNGGITSSGRVAFLFSDNVIGTNPAGTIDLSTGTSGIAVGSNSAGGIISGNTIGYSGRGIAVAASTLTTISENQLICNGIFGIGRTGNTLEIDITSASVATISGTSNVAGGTVEVFMHSTTGCGTGIPCQGRTFLGSTTVAGGTWSLDVSGQVNLGDMITATVTDEGTAIPTTSEFATCATISCPVITTTIDETPSCVAANNGSLTANPVGGQEPYTFIWNNGGTTATISDLPPGAYNVIVVDANGCRSIADGEVAEVAGPTADAGPDQVICAGSETTLTATATGGTGPYTYVWEPGGAGASITVSPSTSTVYGVTATDSQGCEDGDQVMVRVDPGPQQPDAGPDQTLCADQTASLQGDIGGDPTAPGLWTASVAGGTFSPDATTLNADYTPPAGISTVTLTLSTTNGSAECPDLSDEMTITYTDGITVDAGPDQTVCTASPATLAGVIGGSGVSGGWSASVAGGTFSPDSLDVNAVYTPPAGATSVILTLLARDASGLGLCPDVRDQMTITYTENSATVEAGPAQVICGGETVALNGSFGGTATSAQWSTDGDGTFADINAPETTYTPGPGDITSQGVTLTLTTNSAAGCPPVADNVDMRIIAAPDYTLTGIDPSTCGDPDGTIVVSGLTPGAGYDGSYVLDGAVIPISQDASAAGEIRIDNLGDGTYTDITLTDGNGCSGTPGTITLMSPDGPTASATPVSICAGNAGELSGNPNGGTPPYTHAWVDQSTGSATGYTLSNLTFQTLNIDAATAQAGTVDLEYQVTDSNGCTASANVTINITAGPTVTIIQQDSASTINTADGQLLFTISGGQQPYDFSWTGPSPGTAGQANAGNATINNLLTGNYSLQLSDANGCSTTARFRIGVTVTGGGECTTDAGSLEEIMGGNIQACSSSPVELVHNGDEFLDANDALVFVLKEMSGVIIKTNTEPVFEYDPASMTLNTQYLAAARAGNATGPAGGIDPGDPCLSESNTVSIVFQESLTGVLNFLQGEETLCQGEELILSTNNLGSVDYFWITPARDTLRTNESMVVLNNIRTEDAGDYYVIARDGDCLNDQTGPFTLMVNGLPVGTPICAGDDQTVCERTVSLQACDPGPGIGTWSSLSGARLNNAGNANTTASDLLPGENLFVWTVNIPECGSIGSDTVRVVYESSLFAQPDAFVLERANTEIFMDVLKNDNIATGADIELTALTEPEFGVLETLPHGFRFYETEQRRGLVEFVYQVCYLGGTCMGTCDTATVQIEVLNLPYLPQGITPDGDGRNDELTVLGYTPGNADLRLQLTIANQWGEIIFQSNDYTNSEPWDGTFNGKPVPQGAYYCHLETIVPEGNFPSTQTVYVVR